MPSLIQLARAKVAYDKQEERRLAEVERQQAQQENDQLNNLAGFLLSPRSLGLDDLSLRSLGEGRPI